VVLGRGRDGRRTVQEVELGRGPNFRSTGGLWPGPYSPSPNSSGHSRLTAPCASWNSSSTTISERGLTPVLLERQSELI
jgi:hypothetical protein